MYSSRGSSRADHSPLPSQHSTSVSASATPLLPFFTTPQAQSPLNSRSPAQSFLRPSKKPGAIGKEQGLMGWISGLSGSDPFSSNHYSPWLFPEFLTAENEEGRKGGRQAAFRRQSRANLFTSPTSDMSELLFSPCTPQSH